MTDERIYSVAYKASRLAFLVFGIGGAVAGATLLAIAYAGNTEIEPIGLTLCYAVCALLIVYNISYIYYNRKSGGNE